VSIAGSSKIRLAPFENLPTAFKIALAIFSWFDLLLIKRISFGLLI
jgi:hypothetical protein